MGWCVAALHDEKIGWVHQMDGAAFLCWLGAAWPGLFALGYFFIHFVWRHAIA